MPIALTGASGLIVTDLLVAGGSRKSCRLTRSALSVAASALYSWKNSAALKFAAAPSWYTRSARGAPTLSCVGLTSAVVVSVRFTTVGGGGGGGELHPA